MNANVPIEKINASTYEIDLTNVTTGNGYYVFTAQAAGVRDISGTYGMVGKQIAWTQFLSVPSVKSFIGLPAGYIGNAYDTTQLYLISQ